MVVGVVVASVNVDRSKRGGGYMGSIVPAVITRYAGTYGTQGTLARMAHSTAYEFQWNSAYELCIWHTEGTLVRLRHTEGRLVRLRHTAQRTNSNEPCYMAHGRYTGTYGTDNVRLHISYACAPTCVCVSRFAVCLVCFFAKWAHCDSTRQLHTRATHARYTRKLHTRTR